MSIHDLSKKFMTSACEGIINDDIDEPTFELYETLILSSLNYLRRVRAEKNMKKEKMDA